MTPPKNNPNPPSASRQPTILRVLYKNNCRRGGGGLPGLLIATDFLKHGSQRIGPGIEKPAASQVGKRSQFFRAALAEQNGKHGNAAYGLALGPVPVGKLGLREPPVVLTVRHQYHSIVTLLFALAALLGEVDQSP